MIAVCLLFFNMTVSLGSLGEPGLVQCILGYRNLNYQEPSFVWTQKKLVNFHEFYYNLQDGGHLV